MKQRMRDEAPDQQGGPDKSSGDGVLKDLVAQAKAMAPALAKAAKDADPRRRGEIVIKKEGNHWAFFIDNLKWAEVEFSASKQRWCIQDCCGYCLMHHEHIQREFDGRRDAALDICKSMIRDGSMPSPEAAKAAFKARTGSQWTLS